ncbi:Ribosomal-protein-S18p-alanine acetyltransferase [uncultured Candidatus Thioglobus sp.]|nr:Ribosomal-protein-S18p-alanine acetyltransferase [uncultured Candidatus Thioglobus sp.]
MAIKFRKATDDDINALHQLDQLSDSEHHWKLDFFSKNKILLAVIDREIAGFLAYQLSDVVEILRISTHPVFHRQGVASALIEQLKQHTLPIWLEVRAGNGRAYGLYKKLNFKETGIRKKYYSDGEDAKIMLFK